MTPRPPIHRDQATRFARTRSEQEAFEREERLDRFTRRALLAIAVGGPMLVVGLLLAWRFWPEPNFICTPASLIQQEPRQVKLRGVPPWSHQGAMIRPLARYEITGLLMSKRAYSGDGASSISKWDLSIIWGAMTDPAILAGVEFRQYDRATAVYFHQRPQQPSWKVLLGQLSNLHAIHATPEVLAKLDALAVGSVVTLKGKLVSANLPGSYPWTSSLTRYDEANGACEIMWVEDVTSVTQTEYKMQHATPN